MAAKTEIEQHWNGENGEWSRVEKAVFKSGRADRIITLRHNADATVVSRKSAETDGQLSSCMDAALGRIEYEVAGGELARNVEVQSGEGGRLALNW